MARFFGFHGESLMHSKELGWSVEEVQTSKQPDTHIDAPYNDQ